MKIEPGLLPSSMAQRSVASTAAVLPFETVLGQASHERALGFSELGVFGTAHSTGAPASGSARLNAHLPERRPATAGDKPLEPISPMTFGEGVQSLASAPLPSASPSGAASENSRGDRQAPAVAIPGESPLAFESPGLPAEDGEPAPLRALSRALLAALGAKAGSTSRVTITTDGHGGGAQIVISAPDLTPREVRDLRRAATRLTAHHRLSLDSLTLNGVKLEPLAQD